MIGWGLYAAYVMISVLKKTYVPILYVVSLFFVVLHSLLSIYFNSVMRHLDLHKKAKVKKQTRIIAQPISKPQLVTNGPNDFMTTLRPESAKTTMLT